MFTYPLFGGAGPSLGFVHPGSAMFNREFSGNFLQRTYVGDAEDRTRGTVAFWFRLGEIGNLSISRTIFGCGADGNNSSQLRVDNNGNLEFIHRDGAAVTDNLKTNRVLRDPTAWYFGLFWYDTGQAVDSDRMGFEVNGVVASLVTANYPALNKELDFGNNGQACKIGQKAGVNDEQFEGFLADMHWTVGVDYRSDSFGRFEPIHGEWIPIQPFGLTYGNHGFHLDFADPADLGNDVSGQGNDYTAQGTFGAANAFLDVPANTFPILNSADANTGADFSRACLTVNEASASASSSRSTHVFPQGKWYLELTRDNSGLADLGVSVNGEQESGRGGAAEEIPGFSTLPGVIIRSTTGTLYRSPYGASDGSFGGTSTTNDVISIAVDASDPENIDIWFAKNGTWLGSGSPNPATGTSPAATITATHPQPAISQLTLHVGCDTSGQTSINFGQERGGFSYSIPNGFKELSTGNFPDPTGPALFPDRYFKSVEYEGDGAATQAVTGVGFQSDMVWLKNLDAGDGWRVAINMADYVPSPSTPNNLQTHSTSAASDFVQGNIDSLDSDGFTVGEGSSSPAAVNTNGETYQAWCWKSDPAAGFEIIRYTGDGVAGRTVPHNLDVVPEYIAVKRLDGTGNWNIYNLHYGRVTDPETDYLWWNSLQAAVDNVNRWNDTVPTTTEFTLGAADDVNALDGEYVALVWASVPGFSKMYSMEGNGNANGAIVPLDFAPRFYFAKNANSGTASWLLQDEDMDSDANGNVKDQRLLVEAVTARTTDAANQSDVLANGIKRRGTGGGSNTNGSHYQGMAYARVASKFARGR